MPDHSPSAPGFNILLTVSEVAELLRVSRATVYGLMKRGKIPSVLVSEAFRIRPVDFDAALRHRPR